VGSASGGVIGAEPAGLQRPAEQHACCRHCSIARASAESSWLFEKQAVSDKTEGSTNEILGTADVLREEREEILACRLSLEG
jgi:hypothetical protein